MGAETPGRFGSRRDRVALLLALVTAVCVIAAFFASQGTQLLMPGPLASAHGSVEKCSACHTKSGSGKLSWVHGLVAGDPLADSKACLTCHKMPDTAFNAHGASAEVLKQNTARLTKVATATPRPPSARAQSAAFPTDGVVARGLYCATCHQEHQGIGFKLSKISDEQCRSCHLVKFDSFDGHHPQFESYPFKRRTKIIYDHAAHFGKHYPELAKKDPARRIPEACSTCHSSRMDKRVMAVEPFEKTCTTCHLDQIIGKERVSGPKGVAFLSLPGLDLQTLRTKSASTGEWPDASEAALTPFMKMMISRDERGRALLKILDKMNLQDLSGANDEQIKAVTTLVWEVKRIFYALIKGKVSDVLGDFNVGGGAKLGASLVADLTAGIPRDVIVGAQQQWLPNLGAEMANGGEAGAKRRGATAAVTTPLAPPESVPRERAADADAREGKPEDDEQKASSKAAKVPKRDPPPCLLRVFGQCLMDATPAPSAGAVAEPDSKNAKTEAGTEEQSPGDLPPAMRAGVRDAAPVVVAQSAEPAGAGKVTAGTDPLQGKAADQKDDLLFPTEEELRAIKAHNNGAVKSSGAKAPADASASAPIRQTGAAPAISIASDVDPESWAEYGGWYRQDYAIYYRPAGHKDKFVYSWLSLTGPQASRGGKGPATAVFDALASKDAQGSCTKCHSVDDVAGKGKLVNFSPTSAANKQGRFTTFIHGPHLGALDGRSRVEDNRGCLTCHGLAKERPYLKSYEQGSAQRFVSNFSAMKKDLCQTCHTSSMARQDCLLCHKYHVNGAITPEMKTRLPLQ